MKITTHLPKLILIVVFLIVAYFFFKYQDRRAKEDRLLLEQEYPELTISESVTGRISNIYHGNLNLYRNVYSQAYVTLADGRKLSVAGDIDEPGHSPTLDEVIEVGDSLVKRPNHFSFIIIKSDGQLITSRYNFKLR